MTAEQVRWCGDGCGWEGLVTQLKEGLCPKCGHATLDFGWRYYGARHEVHYTSSWKTLPKEER